MPIVCNELLGRDLLKIYQDTDYFNFSIDSVLLASFPKMTKRIKKVCDLCSGNAPIPLYLSLRFDGMIYGVEIQSHSYDLANMSINENNLNDRIKMLNRNLIGVNEELGVHTFDLVTCNPPFFKVGSNNVNPLDSKAIARHEIMASLDDIVKEASLLLNNCGHFVMAHRPDRLVEILDTFRKYKIEPKRLQFIYPKIGSECNHILIDGVKDGNSGLRVLPPLYVYKDDNNWTDDVLKIYNYEGVD